MLRASSKVPGAKAKIASACAVVHAIAITALAAACSGSADDERPPLYGNQPPIGETDGSTPPGDGGPNEQDGAIVQDGASGDGSRDGSPDGPVAEPATCQANGTWGAGSALPISTANEDLFGTITSNELTLAFMSRDGVDLTVHVADRAAATEPFSTPLTFDGSPYAFDRVALSDDGLRIALVNADRRGFTQLVREQRGQAFEPSPADPFDAINATGQEMPVGEFYGDPLLTPPEFGFYYSRFGAGRVDTLFFANHIFANDPFSDGVIATTTVPQLKAVGDERRRPTGISADLRSFFFWDEVEETSLMGMVRPFTGTDFERFVDLGNRPNAMVNAACNRLYYSNGDLMVAPRN